MSRILKALQQLEARGAWSPETDEKLPLDPLPVQQQAPPADRPAPAVCQPPEPKPAMQPVQEQKSGQQRPASNSPYKAPAFHDAYGPAPVALEMEAELLPESCEPTLYSSEPIVARPAGQHNQPPEAAKDDSLFAEVEHLVATALGQDVPEEAAIVKEPPCTDAHAAEAVDAVEVVEAAPTVELIAKIAPVEVHQQPAGTEPAGTEPAALSESVDSASEPAGYELSEQRSDAMLELQVRFDERLSSAPTQPTKLERKSALDLIDVVGARPYQELVNQLLGQISAPHATLAFATAQPEAHLVPTIARVALELPRRERGRVLLIDGDLAERRLSQEFELANKPGMAEVLSQDELWHQVVQPAYTRGLYVLPAGKASYSGQADPAALGRLMSQLKKHWSLVLVIAGSLQDSVAMNLCCACDHTYMLVRLGESSTDAVEEAAASLRSQGASLAGCVATNVPAG